MQILPKIVGIPWSVFRIGHLKHPLYHPYMNFRQPLIAYNEAEADASANIAAAIIEIAADQSLQSNTS